MKPVFNTDEEQELQKNAVKVYDRMTGAPTMIDADSVDQAILNGTHGFDINGRVNVVDQNGEASSIPASQVHQALQEGYSIEKPNQRAVRKYVEENEGLKGAAKVFLGQAVDEALMGVPELVADKTLDPLELAKKEALKKQHDFANTMGGVTGFLGSLSYGAPIAKLGAKAAEKLVGEQLIKAGVAEGANLGSKVISSAITAAGEGVAMSAPRAVTEAALGDPKEAAESLALGLGTGALFGATSPMFKKLYKSTLQVGSKAFKNVSKAILPTESDAVYNVFSMTPSDITRFEKNSRVPKGEILEFMKTRVTPSDVMDDGKLVQKLESVIEEEGDKIGTILNTIDEEFKTNPNKQLINGIIENTESRRRNMVRELKAMASKYENETAPELKAYGKKMREYIESEDAPLLSREEILRDKEKKISETLAKLNKEIESQKGKDTIAKREFAPLTQEVKTYQSELDKLNDEIGKLSKDTYFKKNKDAAIKEEIGIFKEEVEKYERQLKDLNTTAKGKEKVLTDPLQIAEYDQISKLKQKADEELFYEELHIEEKVKKQIDEQINSLTSKKTQLEKQLQEKQKSIEDAITGRKTTLEQEALTKRANVESELQKIKGVLSGENIDAEYLKDLGVYSTKGIQALHRSKKSLQNLVNYNKQIMVKQTPMQAFYDKAAKLNTKMMHDFAEEFSRKLGNYKSFSKIDNPVYMTAASDLSRANRAFGIASGFLPYAQKRAGKTGPRSIFSFNNLIPAAAGATFGAGLGGPVGAAIGAVIPEVARFGRPVLGLYYAEKAQAALARKLDVIPSAISKLGVETSGIRPATINAMGRFLTGNEEQSKETKLEQFEKLNEKLSEFASDPQKMIDSIAKVTIPMGEAMPQIKQQYQDLLTRQFAYLSQVMPKNTSPENPFVETKWQPSDRDLNKFERVVAVVQDPFVIIGDLKNGSLTKDQVDAVQAVYPKIYARIQQKVLDTVTKDKKKLNYQARLKLGLLFSTPTDVSLRNVAAKQQIFAPIVAETPNGTKVQFTAADAVATENQKLGA